MQKKRSLSWQIGAAYIGTVIGAGFASGQEIMQFFTVYGSLGMLLLLLSGVLFSICGYGVFYLSRHYKTYDYNSFIIKICGPRFSLVYDCIITMFLFFGVSIMFSGGGALVEESLKLGRMLGIAIIAATTLLVVLKSIEGILEVNSFVVPTLTAVILFVLLKTIISSDLGSILRNSATVYKGDIIKPMFSMIFYCSYNLVLSIGVLTAFPQEISSIKALKHGAYIGGFGLMALSAALNLCLIAFIPAILRLSIPVLYISSLHGTYIKYAVLICIWCEICTTAIANVFSLAKRIVKNRPKLYKLASLFIVIAGIPMAFVDFKSLVSFFYPLFGGLSMFLAALILIRFVQLRAERKGA